MKLRQINIEYKAEEDRLIMRIASGANQEVLLWLTRRCVKLLWGVLLQMVRSVPVIATQSHPEAKSALMGMRHEEALAKTDFSKPYEPAPAPEHPLGATPILVGRLQTKRNEDGSFVLTLLPMQGQGINLNLDEKLLHSVCGLLRKVTASTDWGLQLDWPEGAAAGSQAEPRTLN
jgi:hypothetical protein